MDFYQAILLIGFLSWHLRHQVYCEHVPNSVPNEKVQALSQDSFPSNKDSLNSHDDRDKYFPYCKFKPEIKTMFRIYDHIFMHVAFNDSLYYVYNLKEQRFVHGMVMMQDFMGDYREFS